MVSILIENKKRRGHNDKVDKQHCAAGGNIPVLIDNKHYNISSTSTTVDATLQPYSRTATMEPISPAIAARPS
jgi:hypothetical protein